MVLKEENILEFWVTEYQTPALGYSLKVKETLRVETTKYQELAVVETEQFGKMLFLDGMVMTSDKDEFVYHEMIAWPALQAHPKPERVLIIGGGDGGVLREVLKHPELKEAVLVEIDERVIQASRDFFPEMSCAFENPKAKVIVKDGIKFIKESKELFDIVIIDSTEPVGPAVELFSKAFYQNVYEALKADGIIVAQSESPFFNQDVIAMAFGGIKKVFPITKLYLASIPTYPSGLWSFTIGSKKHDPEIINNNIDAKRKYYSQAVHEAAFKLPVFTKEIIEGL